MKRVVDVLYGLKGYPNAARFTDFKTDLFANGSTPAIVMDTASTTGISVTAACTTGLLISGACSSDGISITGICADAIHISGANTANAIHISGDQAVAILFDVTAAATDGLKIAVPAGITLTDGIDITCVSTGTVTNAINITYTNSATEVMAVTVATGKTITTGISFSGAGTYTTGILMDATAIGTGLAITGTCATACIDFGAASVTTGSLIDYVGIVGKVSGYLFNGSMTTSTLTASTLIDDFSCTCAHDGAAADTLRMIRRIWSGALPNGTAAADFVLAELQCSSTIGTAASKTGSATGLKVDFGSATVNDSALTLYGIYVDTTVTNTLSAAVHGIYVTSAQYGLSIGDDCSTAINIVDASDLTNLFKFNEAAGCILNVDVSPNDTPSDGGLGADACIRIDINGADYFIPIFAVELS